MSEKGRILADRYELKELIGQGGMADVYLAYDDILKREVAVKILRSSLTGDLFILRVSIVKHVQQLHYVIVIL